MIHRIKIKPEYKEHIDEGKKKFEVRFNDRDYQVGDELAFVILGDEQNAELYHPSYRIVYVHTRLGMQENYVVLGLEHI